MTFNKNIGMLLLAVYLILVGLIGVFGFYFGVIPGIIALLAGIFIILGRYPQGTAVSKPPINLRAI